MTSKVLQQKDAIAQSKFGSLSGCAVELSRHSGFPIPQMQGYQLPNYCKIGWKRKIQAMGKSEYATVCTVVPAAGWATKEKCRRSVVSFKPEVVAVLRQSFDAKPRLNNYEIHKRLKQTFKLGPKMLRVSQISGWVSSEVKRRKNAAAIAVADVAQMVEEAAEKGQAMSPNDENLAFQQHVGLAMGIGLVEKEFTPDVLAAWKQNWAWQRYQRCPSLWEQSKMAASEAWQQQHRQQEQRRKGKEVREQLKLQKQQERETRQQLRQQEQQEREQLGQQKQQEREAREQQKQQEREAREQLRQQEQQGGEARGQQRQRQQAVKRKPTKVPTRKPAVAEKRHKQPPGTEHCWKCGLDVPVADYDYSIEGCRDTASCNAQAEKNGGRKRQRTKKKPHTG